MSDTSTFLIAWENRTFVAITGDIPQDKTGKTFNGAKPSWTYRVFSVQTSEWSEAQSFDAFGKLIISHGLFGLKFTAYCPDSRARHFTRFLAQYEFKFPAPSNLHWTDEPFTAARYAHGITLLYPGESYTPPLDPQHDKDYVLAVLAFKHEPLIVVEQNPNLNMHHLHIVQNGKPIIRKPHTIIELPLPLLQKFNTLQIIANPHSQVPYNQPLIETLAKVDRHYPIPPSASANIIYSPSPYNEAQKLYPFPLPPLELRTLDTSF